MIVLRGLGKSFAGRPAVDGVSIQIQRGCPLVIEGPSGSGKTTLLRLIAGLEVPDAGEVELAGRTVSRPGWVLPPHLRGIGFVFQEPALWPHMTVAENIGFALDGSRRGRVRELLELTGLTSVAGRRPREISGGEAARAALARALAPEPRYLLMDEPLSHLDPDLKRSHLELILRSAEAWQSCLVYVTHDAQEAAGVGGRKVRMSDGRLVGFQDFGPSPTRG